MATQLPLRRPARPASPAHELLDELAHRGVELWADRGMVHWRAAPGNMNVELMLAIKRHEDDLCRLIAQEEEPQHG